MRFVFLPLALVLACAAPPEPEPRGYTVDGALRAPTGEAIFLRSINVHEDAKWDEAQLIPLRDDELAKIHAGGFNSVRFLTFWSAVAPEPGVVDRDYLARLRAEVQKISDDELYLVIDMHQDLWGAPFGNGAPDWACPAELKAGFEATSPWWANYFSGEVSACFDRLWLEPEAQAPLLDAWREVAGALCDVEGVVGFDLMNEPWPGSFVGEQEFDQALLYEGYYARAMDAVEEVCPGKVFFLEPSRAYDFGLTAPLALRPEDEGRVVIAPHFYPVDVHEPGRAWDTPRAELEAMVDHLYGPWLDAGVPLWLGEVGGITDNPGFDAYLADLHALLLERGVGHSLWAFSEGGGYAFLDERGAQKPVFDAVAARPVPTLLPSWPVEMRFEDSALHITGECVAGKRLEIRGGTLEIDGPIEDGRCTNSGAFSVIAR